MTGNPVECVIHPDLWNKSELWDPLGIGRVSLDHVTERNLDDEYVEENYGIPINTVRERKLINYIMKPFRHFSYLYTVNESRKYFPHFVACKTSSLMKPQQKRIFSSSNLDFAHIIP